MSTVSRAAIDQEAKEALRPHLERGEKLVWAGRPAPGRMAKGQWMLLIFAVPWNAFVAFWMGGVLLTVPMPEKLFMALFGVPFVAIGAFLLASPVLMRRAGKHLAYGVTDRRALIVRGGKRPRAGSWGPDHLAALIHLGQADGTCDLFFAVDQGIDALVPGAGQGLAKVGFLGVPDDGRARAALSAVADLPRPTFPAPRREARPGEPEAFVEAKGALQAFRVKVERVVAERRATAERKRAMVWSRVMPWAAAVAAAVLGVVVLSGGRGATSTAIVLLGMIGVVAGAVGFIWRATLGAALAKPQQGAGLDALLAGWEADAHPKARFSGWVDLGEASAVPPYRFAESASSKRLKTYHRHRWARFVWAPADGGPLVVELVDKVKYKAGLEVERHPQLRGRMLVNEAVWRRPTRPFKAGPLRVVPVEVGDRVALIFRGPLATPDAAGDAIAALYRALDPCGKG